MAPETIDGILALPAWVQAFLAFFVLMFVVMLFGTSWKNWRVRARFAALAQPMGARIAPGHDKFSQSFEVERDGRRFTVRRELHDIRSATARGPRGFLLFCETALVGTGWQHCTLDIAEAGSLPPIGSEPFTTKDATFDRRFTTWQQGVPWREGGFDAPCRGAVTTLFERAPLSGSLWVRDGRLQYVMVAPNGIEPTALNPLLDALAAVALAFENAATEGSPASV